jgi:hypothetical protein
MTNVYVLSNKRVCTPPTGDRGMSAGREPATRSGGGTSEGLCLWPERRSPAPRWRLINFHRRGCRGPWRRDRDLAVGSEPLPPCMRRCRSMSPSARACMHRCTLLEPSRTQQSIERDVVRKKKNSAHARCSTKHHGRQTAGILALTRTNKQWGSSPR